MIARVVLSGNISSGPRGVERVDECNGDIKTVNLQWGAVLKSAGGSAERRPVGN